MTFLHTPSGRLKAGIVAAVAGIVLAFPIVTARADDDWDDDAEDYYEELEERREEARERNEEWREDERERWEDRRDDDRWRGRQRYPGYYGPGIDYRNYRGGPVYRSYGNAGPRYYQYYESRPVPRYYGTPRAGYSEYGRQRSLRIGGVEVHWNRD